MDLSRREFVAAMAAVATAAPTSREKLHEFDYADVTLTGGPLKRQYDHVHKHFLALDNDRLLKVYRQRAGLPAPGEDMGGWYDADGFVPGHTLGQYISGLSRYYRATRDAATRAKILALVDGYAATLGPNGYPYASEKGATTWPCYILDKYEIGLIDAYRLADVPQAKALLARVIRGAIGKIPDHTYDRDANSPKQAPYDEPYILPENLFHSYEVTREKQFLDMAKLYLLNELFFDPLSRNENILPGKHSYSHTIALSSGAKVYLTLGDEKYLRAIRNAWDMLEKTQLYASGGSGPKETFVPPGEGKLGESITTMHEHFETPCGYYAHSKLARYLLRITGESRYGDGLERLVYNTMLACKDPGGDGQYFYYSDYHPQTTKGYYHRKWPCCSGTYVQGVADYLLNLYFQTGDAVYVNMYAPSELRWKGVKLITSTAYPKEEDISIRIETRESATFAVNLRIPAWLEEKSRLAVNGKPVKTPQKDWASIRRRWTNGDTIDLKLPLARRTEPIDDQHPNLVALMRGPVMMVALEPLGEGFRPFYEIKDEVYTTYVTNPRSSAFIRGQF